MAMLDVKTSPTFPTTDRLVFGLEPKRIYVTKPAKHPRRRPVVPGTEPFAPAFIVPWHAQPTTAAKSAGLSCLVVKDAMIVRHGQVIVQDRLLAHSAVMPKYVRQLVQPELPDNGDIAPYRNLPARRIEEPCVLLFGHGATIYGHFLVEFLPRLFAARRLIARENMTGVRFVVSQSTPTWLRGILHRHFGITEDQLVDMDWQNEQLILSQAIIPEYPLDQETLRFDPAFGEDLDRLATQVAGKMTLGPQRWFLSRALFGSRSGRWSCANEGELVALAARKFGFAPIAAETLSWENQVLVMRTATHVVGEYGSALHSVLFSPETTRVGCIGMGNTIQASIAALRGQQNGYLDTPLVPNFTVDVDRFEKFLSALCA